MNKEKTEKKQFDYKDTLNLPTTNFPMKANLAHAEPKTLEFWQKIDLYNLLQEIHKDHKVFIFQDGPPYANGDIHLGHAFNRILKDFIVKSKSLSGYKVPFIPGWDCHGLPIEIKVEKELNQQSHQMDKILFITKCREYATGQINNQRKQFIRLGVVANWQHPYATMDFKFEATVVRTLAKIMANGHITRGDRPVHWCINCGSALAEAEVEYKEKQSPSIYVAFDILDNNQILTKFKLQDNFLKQQLTQSSKISVLTWTTTPWTIPAIQGVAVNPKYMYCLLYSKKSNRSFIVAEQLASNIITVLQSDELNDYAVIAKCSGVELEYTVLQHPLYSRTLPIIFGEHVTVDAGTGCVTTAPAHGHDDYITGKKYNLSIENFINNRGCFLETTEFFANLHINKATPKILEMLKQNNNLLSASEILHSYPHCWRHKTPIIFMATPQWFISMEKNHLRTQALEAVDNVHWFPNWGKNRMESMLPAGRLDWCISRQRVWGVPIPFFIHKDTGELHPNQLGLLELVAKQIEKNGIEAWHKLDSKELLGDDVADDYIKSTDVLDVWFESGTVNCCINSTHPEMQSHADLYLEGSDQHRGWFQSSLLVSIAANNAPPFKQVLTHGFILDAAGNKMSKSVGNTVVPEDIINKYGADILRLWVATTDYSGDLKISEEILKRVSDAYRRIRNTARFLLANLHDFDSKQHIVPIEQMLLLDHRMLNVTIKLQEEILQCYTEYKYHLAYQKILNFCVEELGSFYLDIIKDRQYTCKTNSIPRRSAQTALYYILEALVRWIAPILSFTAEEIWEYIPNREDNSVFLTTWYNNWPNLSNNNLKDKLIDEQFWNIILVVRKEVNKQIEVERNAGNIGSGLEAEVAIRCNLEIFEVLNTLQSELKFLLITSSTKIILDENQSSFYVTVNCSSNPKCARCWHRVTTIDDKCLCDRCKINLTTANGETRIYA